MSSRYPFREREVMAKAVFCFISISLLSCYGPSVTAFTVQHNNRPTSTNRLPIQKHQRVSFVSHLHYATLSKTDNRNNNITSGSYPPSITTSVDDDYDDDDDDSNNGPQKSLTTNDDLKSYTGHHTSSFRKFLKTMIRTTPSKKTLANRMDDELKRMEILYYNLKEGNQPRLWYSEDSYDHYDGDIIMPDVSCYAMVATSYAKAGLGEVGAKLANDVYQRCEKYANQYENNNRPRNEDDNENKIMVNVIRPNAILKTACMQACVQADNWTQVDEWLHHMETTFAETGLEVDAPDTVTYTCYLEGLSDSRTLSKMEIVNRTDKIWKQITDPHNPITAYAVPNRFTYNAAIKNLARAEKGMETYARVEQMLKELEQAYDETGDLDLKPKSATYLTVLNAAARCRGGIEVADRAFALFQELRRRGQTDRDYHPNDIIYVALLTAYARVGKADASKAARKADEILTILNKDPGPSRPSVHLYTAAINAKVIDNNATSILEAKDILRKITYPDNVAYECVIRALTRVNEPEKADALLWELIDLAAKGENGKLKNPSLTTVAACINAWVKYEGNDIGIDTIVDRVTKLLQIIIDAYRTENQSAFQKRHVEGWIFDEVVRMWSISRRYDAGEQAEKIIAVVEELHEKTGFFPPSYHSYLWALDAWASCRRKEAGKNALALLEKMQQVSEKLGESSKGWVNARALSSALNAVSKSGGRHSADAAQRIFLRMVDLYKAGDRTANINARTATSALSTIVKTSDYRAIQKAKAILQQMTALADEGFENFRPNTIVYNCILSGMAERGMAEDAEALLNEMKESAAKGFPCNPDVISISCVCRAFANGSKPGSGPLAEEYLRLMQEKYRDGDLAMKPDTRLYNAVISAYAKDTDLDPKATGKAESILREMEMSLLGDNPIKPDLVSFSAVIQAYISTKQLEKAEKILAWAETLAASGQIKPFDLVFYASVILSFTRSTCEGSMERAEEIVEKMIKLSKEENRKEIHPNTQVFNTLLAGWAFSHNPERLQKCIECYEKMEKLAEGTPDVKPDVFSHNWMILASARSEGAMPAERRIHFDVALEHFRCIHHPDNNLLPNAFTYSYFLFACRRLLADGVDRQKLATKTFNLCKDAKLVTIEVLVEAFRVYPELVRDELVAKGLDFNLDDGFVSHIPEDWCSNIRPKKHFRNVELRRSRKKRT